MDGNGNKPLAPTSKPQLMAGGAISAIVPQDFESAYRMAQVVVAARMTPKSIETVEQACVAIMHGLEVGLTPMAALQSIAVINGMPTIWGDGMLGLVRASGLLEDIIEEVELDETGEPLVATCKVKRKGESSWAVSTFTRVEAQRAGLWNKAGPWQGYRPRMMKMRARSWALRDKFADVLRGLYSAEEAQDMFDVTRRGSASTAPPEPMRRNPFTDVPRSDESPIPSSPVGCEPAVPQIPPVDTVAAAAAPILPISPVPGDGSEPPPTSSARVWRVPDNLVGQDAILKALNDLFSMVETLEELHDFERQNVDRIAKITGVKGGQLKATLAMRRRTLFEAQP